MPGLENGASRLSMLDAISIAPLNAATVLTGRSALAHRYIRWVQALNWPSAGFVQPGDLILTTGVAPSPRDAATFLRDVVESDAAALVLSQPPGDMGPDLDSALAAAAHRSFPILTLPWDIPFSDVTRRISIQILAAGCTAAQPTCGLRHGMTFSNTSGPSVPGELQRAMTRQRDDAAQVEIALGHSHRHKDPDGRLLASSVHEVERLCHESGVELRVTHRSGVALLVAENPRSSSTALRSLVEQACVTVGDTGSSWELADERAEPELAAAQQVETAKAAMDEHRLSGPSLKSLFLLGAMAQNPLIGSVLASAVQPLVDYDAKRGRNLLETLEVFLDESCNTSAAARRLFLNRHSLMYRLRKIEGLTGFSLKEPSDRFLLQAGVRLHRYDLVD